ncbi:MAG: hypothetical protein LBR06_02720 [Bacteroidales bacterium]|jgi:hypothetical protein|nr:hypothetical protein [Bacteroidales bacterium]
MKRILTVAFFLAAFTAVAQPPKDKNGADFEKYKAQKVSFMTERLELSPKEAQQFWPLYNELDTKRSEIHHKLFEMEQKLKEQDKTLKEQDALDYIRQTTELFQQDVNLRKEYNEKFRKVLPARKVAFIGIVENEFRFKMIREFRDREDGPRKSGDDKK